MTQTKRKTRFIRQESWRYRRVKNKWRKPKGNASRMRKKYSGLPNLVSVGYGTMKSRKGLHPSGYREIIIYNQNQLDSLKRDIEAVRISAQVGEKKRLSIIEKAEKLDLKILNPPHIDEEISTTDLPLEETEK